MKGRYGNVKKPVEDGIRFDSQRELKRYRELRLLERAGEIFGLTVHKRFDLAPGGVQIKLRSDRYPNGRKLQYEADFTYSKPEAFDDTPQDAPAGWRSGGVKLRGVIEDVKMQSGHRDPVYKIKKAIMEAMGYEITEL